MEVLRCWLCQFFECRDSSAPSWSLEPGPGRGSANTGYRADLNCRLLSSCGGEICVLISLGPPPLIFLILGFLRTWGTFYKSRNLLRILEVFMCTCACALMCGPVALDLKGILGYPSSGTICLVFALFCTTGSLTVLGLTDQGRLVGQ